MEASIADLRQQVASELREVEDQLATVLQSRVETVPAIYHHARSGGGKRLRPSLLILSAQSVAGDDYAARVSRSDLIHFAAAVEMVHVASLMHDDVVDGSDLRRGRPTANALWRGKLCVFAADFLLADVYARLCTPGHAPLLRELADAVRRMCEGEIIQTANEGNLELTEEEYLRAIEGKTASLMAACTSIGAQLGHGSADQVHALKRFGFSLGVAFQIADDVLDLVGDPARMGKSRGQDLRSGRWTLPLIYALGGMGDGHVSMLRRELTDYWAVDEPRLSSIVEALRATGALSRAIATARDHAATARRALAELPHTSARDLLESLAHAVVARES
ncbi:MAG TPA: polyprenyl synthetase family protein [Armatimonadota bacterium]|nr:polyprenyl synthetase family protein [Armatimonadota bacterium]